MSALGGGKTNELTFQNDMLKHLLLANGWLLGKAEHYNRELALYLEDLLGFAQDTQPEQWQKFCALYSSHPEHHFLEHLASQLNKTAANVGHALRAFCAAPASADHRELAKALTA